MNLVDKYKSIHGYRDYEVSSPNQKFTSVTDPNWIHALLFSAPRMQSAHNLPSDVENVRPGSEVLQVFQVVKSRKREAVIMRVPGRCGKSLLTIAGKAIVMAATTSVGEQ
jgi:hypothetical protein